MNSVELLEVAERLYAGTVGSFVSARDAAARNAEDKTVAAQIKGLKKPSTAAWAVNVLVRREGEQIDQILGLAESLRTAAESLDGDALRTLTRQRRQLTAALTTTAGRLAREYDLRLSATVADQVEGMLNAAMLDPVAAEVVRSGLVLTAFTSTGVSDLDVPAVCAVPSALGYRAPAAQEPPQASPALHLVPDDTLRVESAREHVEKAVRELASATEALQHHTATSENFQARRLQLQGEIDELRRRLAGLEDDVDELDEEIETERETVAQAAAAVDQAEADLASARLALEDLTRR